MSAALRIAEGLERGDGLPDHEGVIAFTAALLAPLYDRTVAIRNGGRGQNYAASIPRRRQD